MRNSNFDKKTKYFKLKNHVFSSGICCALMGPTSRQPFKKKQQHKNHTMTINPMLRFDALYTYKSFFIPLKNNYQNFTTHMLLSSSLK